MNFESILHGAAVAGAWAAVLWVAGSIICIALAQRKPKRKIETPCPCPGCSAVRGSNSVPEVPGAIIVHLSLGGRLTARSEAEKRIRRALGRVDEDIEAITRQIERQN